MAASRRGKGFLLLVAVCVTAAFTLGLTESLASSTAEPRPAPKQKPKCYAQANPVQGTVIDPALPLCGSRKDDILISNLGHNIEAFTGNDTICAKNGVEDDIWGGPETPGGTDRAYVDAIDSFKGRDIEVVTRKPTKWTRKMCPRGRYAAAPVSYAAAPLRIEQPLQKVLRGSAYGPIVFCDTVPQTGAWRIWFPHEPHLSAANTGRGIQWQTVAWSAVLNRLEGTEWVFRSQTSWLWDRSFEEGARKPFQGHTWRQFTGRRDRRFVSFAPSDPGIYQVEIKYHWYKEGRAPDYEFQVGEDDHVGPFETDGNHDSCTFPKAQPPPPPPPAPPPPGQAAVSGRNPALSGLAGGDALRTLTRLALPAPKPKAPRRAASSTS